MANLFNYDVNLQPAVMDIRSETLEPISTSTNRYVFRLDQAGQLDSNSVLLFKPQRVAGKSDNNSLRVNPVGGGLLAIKRATLQVGDYVLNDINDVGKISHLVDMGTINTSNNSKYNSHYFLNNAHYKSLDSGGSADNNATTNGESAHGSAGSIIYDRYRSAVNFGQPNNGFGGKLVNNCAITDDKSKNHQIGIPLGNLFPCLKGQELPLFLFQDYRILLTVEFHTSEKWVNDIDDGSMTADAGFVSVEDVKLQVDYIIYPSEVQNQLKEQTNSQGGLNLAFPDIIKIEKNIPVATANAEQSLEHRIGMDNKEVHKIYMCKQFSRVKNVHDRIFLNARCDGVNQEEYNVNIDGVDIFQEAKWNPNSQYNETTNCLGGELNVPRPVYFCDENTYMSRLADTNGGILGKMKPLCLDLTNGNAGVVGAGRQIGSYPIIWKYKRKPTADVPNTASATPTGNIVESMSGAMSADYFVYCSRTANITSTPSGTAVMVSY